LRNAKGFSDQEEEEEGVSVFSGDMKISNSHPFTWQAFR
jgi:hypothetical protein